MEPRTRARELRANATPSERILWRALSARKVSGVRFNRQVPIGPFICDFVSRSAKLIIEVDGGQHGWQTDEDAARTRYLESQGYRVIRFWNSDVLEGLEGVVAEIATVIATLPSPNPSRKREGNP
ncbi:MAG: endonuclease domain-containing protein [Sphingomonas sp.]|nr:endonuclease domain-containing protein [Sphingomonas sp.]